MWSAWCVSLLKEVNMLFEMFLTFLKIGACTFGGGYAMIPIIQNEIAVKREWMDERDFIDALALAQGSPGPVAVNVGIYVGYKVKGVPGAIVATLGTVLPSFFIILIIAKFFYQYRGNLIIEKIFLGIRPAIVALILSAVYKLMKSIKLGYIGALISVFTVLIIVFLGVNPIYLIIAGALGTVIFKKITKKDNP